MQADVDVVRRCASHINDFYCPKQRSVGLVRFTAQKDQTTTRVIKLLLEMTPNSYESRVKYVSLGTEVLEEAEVSLTMSTTPQHVRSERKRRVIRVIHMTGGASTQAFH